MTIQINTGDHISPEDGFVAMPPKLRPMANWARSKAIWISKKIPSADVYFRTLPQGRSLSQLLDDRTIWINYHNTMLGSGGTSAEHRKEIAIGSKSFRFGRWWVLGTLIHELAHVNGAERTHAAELALLHCGLGKQSERNTGVDDPSTPYNPNMQQ
jgi:predicted Zn-dependent protease